MIVLDENAGLRMNDLVQLKRDRKYPGMDFKHVYRVNGHATHFDYAPNNCSDSACPIDEKTGYRKHKGVVTIGNVQSRWYCNDAFAKLSFACGHVCSPRCNCLFEYLDKTGLKLWDDVFVQAQRDARALRRAAPAPPYPPETSAPVMPAQLDTTVRPWRSTTGTGIFGDD